MFNKTQIIKHNT